MIGRDLVRFGIEEKEGVVMFAGHTDISFIAGGRIAERGFMTEVEVVAVVGGSLSVVEDRLITEGDVKDLAQDLGGFTSRECKRDMEGQDQAEQIGRAMNAGQVQERPFEGGGAELSRLEVILSILVAQLELGQTQLLQQPFVPVQGRFLLLVVGAAVVGTFIEGAVRTLFPTVESALAVRTPVRGLTGPMTGSDLRQTATDFAAQLAGLATIIAVEIKGWGSAMGTATGLGNRAAAPTLDGSQRSVMGLQVGGAQLLPVQGGPGGKRLGRLGQGSLGIDIEIAVMRMLLAEIIAGWNLGFPFRENLLELEEDLLQFLTGKLFAKPQHKSCYFAQGGGSPWNLTGSFDSFQRKETSPPLVFPVKRNLSLRPARLHQLWKLPRHGNSGKIKRPFFHRSHSAWKTLRKKRSAFPTVPTASAASPLNSLALQNCRLLHWNPRFICSDTGTPKGENSSLFDSQRKLKELAA